MNDVYKITSIFLIGIILTTGYVQYEHLNIPETNDGYYVVLELEQYRDGELIHRDVIEDDLILKNFALMVSVLFSGLDSGDAISVDYRDLSGTFRTPSATFSMDGDDIGADGVCHLGTGTTSPTVNDYVLETPVLEEIVADAYIVTSGTQMNVTIDTTFISDGSYSISEAGLQTQISYEMLMCRDTFTPFNVVLNDVIFVRYIWRLNQ